MLMQLSKILQEGSSTECAEHEATEQPEVQLSAEVSISLPDLTDEECAAKAKLEDNIWWKVYLTAL